MKRAAIIILAFVQACSTPAVRDRIVEVDKPVATRPIAAADVPQVPAPLGPRPQSLSAAADVLLSKVCEFVGYALKADPLLRVSAGEKQSPLRVSAGEKQSPLPRYPECEPR